MDPDPSLTSLKQRLELPGEIVVQLTAMKDENRRIKKDLELERRKVIRLATAVKTMWDVVERAFPGGCTFTFRSFPVFRSFRFPWPLRLFERTLISSFICALCWSGRSRVFGFDRRRRLRIQCLPHSRWNYWGTTKFMGARTS